MSKNRKNKITPAKIVSPPEIKQHIKIIAYLTLISLFLFSFYIRGIVPMKAVFQNGLVGFAMDDAVMQMRLVEHAIAVFPSIHNNFYDAYTLFPKGDTIGWGSLYTYIIAFFSVSLSTLTSKPINESIGVVGAFAPAIFGSLLVFPIFYIGKELSGYKAALIGAFLIVILPGQLLSRSILGFSDHHIIEVFFTTLTMLFLIMAFNRPNTKFYSILAGISFGLYLLAWPTGVLFSVIIVTAITIQYILLHFKNQPTNHIGKTSIIMFLIAFIMVLPFVRIDNAFAAGLYSLLHIATTLGPVLFILFLTYLSNNIKRYSDKPIGFVIALLLSLTISFIFLSFLIPTFIQSTLGQWNYMFVAHTGGSATIAEGMALTGNAAMSYFGYNLFISYIAILLLLYLVITKAKSEYTLLIVWTIFIHVITFAQNRFAYYYAINIAILTAFLISYALDTIKAGHISSITDIRLKHLLIIPIIIIIGFSPATSSPFMLTCGEFLPSFTCTRTAGGSLGEGQYEWYESLNWLRYNTPLPDINYLSDYDKPYNYTINDYGIMSWWDYGHIITYWGHRIPNANPFQSGIEKPMQFLTAQTEEQANAILDKYGINNQPVARYVISNAYMAYSIQPVFHEWNGTNYGLYQQIRTNNGMSVIPTLKYYNTFESRLHIFDGDSLKTYRLVHESTSAPWFRGGNEEQQQKYASNALYRTNIPIENTGYIKIFEHVKGASISVLTTPNTPVTASTIIRTNINRTFTYKQSATSDSEGIATFTLPYSNTGPVLTPFDCSTCYFPSNKGGTNFDTYPIEPYTLTSGNKSVKLTITEKDVLSGSKSLWPI